MARQTYPETPAQEAARINAASGDPDGITAEQVANNRQLNQSLTGAFTTGGGLSVNPLATLVARFTQETQASIAAAETSAPQISNALDKAKLDEKIARLSGDLGSGLNGATADNLLAAAQTGMGNISSTVSSALNGANLSSLTSSVSSLTGGLQTAAALTSNAASEISTTLNKLGGGSLASGVQNLATGISKGAGVINNLLSLTRAVNLPKGGELFTQTGKGISLSTSDPADWRVRINCDWTLFKGNTLFDQFVDSGVVFPITPNITLSTKANYTAIEPVHNNYPFQAYKNSAVDEISINGEFISETEQDAAYWIAATTFFKTATKMFFGQGENVGSPPIVCRLNGYGASVFNDVPIVIKSFSVDFPDNVNYIKCTKTGSPTWVPILSNISISVQPIYNRRNLRQFSLQEYAKGSLKSPTGQGYL